MDISVIYRQGNMYLLSYKGLDDKRHYTVKRCKNSTNKVTDANTSDDGTRKHFSDFQRKLKNREQAEKIGCKQQVDTLKECFREYTACECRQLLEQSSDEGVWGIELEDFLQRDSVSKHLFASEAEGCAFIQQCWLKALRCWQLSGKKVAVRCLEQIFNFEERLRIEQGSDRLLLIESLSEWKYRLQADIEATVPVSARLMKLYIYYDMYLEAQELSEKESQYSQMVYMDALINKSRNSACLSFMSPGEVAALLEQVVACSNQLEGMFSYYSTGHHKWQQVTLCISPLLTAIRDKVNGNMFKDSVSIDELAVLYKKTTPLQSKVEERPTKKKVSAILKSIEMLHSHLINSVDLTAIEKHENVD